MTDVTGVGIRNTQEVREKRERIAAGCCAALAMTREEKMNGKKTIALLCAVLTAFSLVACSRNLTDKAEIITLYHQNEDCFLEAADSGDFSSLTAIDGISDVYVSDDYVEIECGSTGFGPETHYYGIYYSETDDLCVMGPVPSAAQLMPDGAGYRYIEEVGDNEYYVEPLGNHFFYYEAHY